MKKRADIAGYILAGGKGKRMGGREKLYLCYRGKYLSLRIMEELDMLEKHYISVAGIPKRAIGNAVWITDCYKEEGPLGGILSGLLLCPENALFVIPCDLFGLKHDLAERMIGEYEKTGRPVFLRDCGKPSPFPGIYTKEMVPSMEKQRMTGNFRMRSLFETDEAKGYVYLDAARELAAFLNLNTEEDYQRLKRRKHEEQNSNGKRSAGTDEKMDL